MADLIEKKPSQAVPVKPKVEPMLVSAKEQGGLTEVKILIRHPMETGQRKDGMGKPVESVFIQNLLVKYKDKEILTAEFGPFLSKDPFLTFKFKGGVKGEKISVKWIDNQGGVRLDDGLIG